MSWGPANLHGVSEWVSPVRTVARYPRFSQSRNLIHYAPRVGAAGVGLGYLGKGAMALYNNYKGGSGKPAARAAAKAEVKAERFGKKFKAEVIKEKKKKGKVGKLEHEVKQLQKKSKSSLGTLIYRVTDGAVQISNQNTAGNETFSLNSTTEIETVLGQLRYYNPSSPATLVTADFTTGSYSKVVNIKFSNLKVTVRNNYQTPCIVRAWKLACKTDNNINPETAWSNGLTDCSNGTLNDLHMYPTDSPQFTDLWKILKEKKFYLNPGQQKTVKISCPSVRYDPSVVDSQTEPNQKDCHTRQIMFNVAGVISHDTVAAQYGCTGCGVDFYIKKTYVVEYEAGANIKYVYLSNNLDTMTTASVVSNMPISDNQSYSVT